MINLSSQSRLTRKREKVSNIAYFNTVIQHHAIRHAHPKEKWHSKSHRSNLVPSIAVGKMGGRGGGKKSERFLSIDATIPRLSMPVSQGVYPWCTS